MADSTSTLVKRVISAVLAGFVVLGLSYYGGRPGIYIVCTIAIVLGIREFSRMAFRPGIIPLPISLLFWAMSVLFYAGLVERFENALVWFALANVAFLSGSLWLARNSVSNENLLPALSVGTFGMTYCVLFPNFAVEMAKMDDGAQWFLFLLLVVFFGDTFAYFGGRLMGRHKLMPNVSPSKTWEGSISGVFGSALAGTVHTSIAMPYVDWYKTVLFCLVCGFVAQSGDLLISLIKRVAQVKDSGHIMPGHGGILDRLDGVFIACPLVYTFALYVTPQ